MKRFIVSNRALTQCINDKKYIQQKTVMDRPRCKYTTNSKILIGNEEDYRIKKSITEKIYIQQIGADENGPRII